MFTAGPSTLFDETQREVLQLITLSMYPSYLQFLNSSRVERKASVAHAAVATESEESTSDSEPSQFGLTPVMTRRAPAPSPETKLPVDVPLTIESACHASGVWHASFIEWCRSQSCGDYVALLQELASFATDEALFGDDQLHLEELNARGETLWADILESVVLRAGVADQVWSNVEKRGWSPSPFGPAADDLRRTIETSLFPRFQAWVAQRQRRVVSPRYSLPSLRDCLMEEDLYERFLAFAETSRSAETLLFWKAAEEYQLRHKVGPRSLFFWFSPCCHPSCLSLAGSVATRSAHERRAGRALGARNYRQVPDATAWTLGPCAPPNRILYGAPHGEQQMRDERSERWCGSFSCLVS